MSVLCSRSHSYFQWQNQDQKSTSLGFQSCPLSNTTNVQFHSPQVFLFVFLSSKFLEINHSLGIQIEVSSISIFDLWNNLQNRRGRERGRNSHSSIPEISCPRKSQQLKPLAAYTLEASDSFFQSLLAQRSLNYTGLVLIPKGLFINTELCNKRRSTFKASAESIHRLCAM